MSSIRRADCTHCAHSLIYSLLRTERRTQLSLTRTHNGGVAGAAAAGRRRRCVRARSLARSLAFALRRVDDYSSYCSSRSALNSSSGGGGGAASSSCSFCVARRTSPCSRSKPALASERSVEGAAATELCARRNGKHAQNSRPAALDSCARQSSSRRSCCCQRLPTWPRCSPATAAAAAQARNEH